MKALINIAGTLLILFGVFVFGYKAINYTEEQKVAEIGNLQLHQNIEKTLELPSPLVGGLSLLTGLGLLAFGNRTVK